MDGRNICANCIKNCAASLKSELAMRGYLTNIYLKKGPKIAYACKLYTSNENSGQVSRNPVPGNSFLNIPVLNHSAPTHTPMFKLPDLSVV